MIGRQRARDGASWYRVVVYHKAAAVVVGLETSVAEEASRGGDLTRHPWIGKRIAKQLGQMVGGSGRSEGRQTVFQWDAMPAKARPEPVNHAA